MDTPEESDNPQTHSSTHTNNTEATAPNRNEHEDSDHPQTHSSTHTNNTEATAPNRNEPEDSDHPQTHSSTHTDTLKATAPNRIKTLNPNQPITTDDPIFPIKRRSISEPGSEVVLHRGERKRSACISLDSNRVSQEKNKKSQAVAETSVGKSIHFRGDDNKNRTASGYFGRGKSDVSIRHNLEKRQENSKESLKERFLNMDKTVRRKFIIGVRSTKCSNNSDMSGLVASKLSIPKTSQNAISCTSQIMIWLLLVAMLTMSLKEGSFLQAGNTSENIPFILDELIKGSRMSKILVQPERNQAGKTGESCRSSIIDLFPELFQINKFTFSWLTVYPVPFYGRPFLGTREVIHRILQGQDRERYLTSEAFRLATFGLDTCVHPFHLGEMLQLARDGYFCDVDGQVRCCECYSPYTAGAVPDHREHCVIRPGNMIADYDIRLDTVFLGLEGFVDLHSPTLSRNRAADYNIRPNAVLHEEGPFIELQEQPRLGSELIRALPGLRRGQGTTLMASDDSSEAGASELMRDIEANINLSNENKTYTARTVTEVVRIAPSSVSSRGMNMNVDDPMNEMYDNWVSSLSLVNDEPANSEEFPLPDDKNVATRQCNIPSFSSEPEISAPLDRQSDIGAVVGTHLQSEVPGNSVSQTLMPDRYFQRENALTEAVLKDNNGSVQNRQDLNQALTNDESAMSEEQPSAEDVKLATKQTETSSSGTNFSLPNTLQGNSDVGAVGGTQPTSNIQGSAVQKSSGLHKRDLRTERTSTGFAQNDDKGGLGLTSDNVIRLSSSHSHENIVNQRVSCIRFHNTRTLSDSKYKESTAQPRTRENRPSNRNNTDTQENGATFAAGNSDKTFLDKKDLSHTHSSSRVVYDPERIESRNTDSSEGHLEKQKCDANSSKFDTTLSAENSLLDKEKVKDVPVETQQPATVAETSEQERTLNDQERNIQNTHEENEGTEMQEESDDTEDVQAEPAARSSTSKYEPV